MQIFSAYVNVANHALLLDAAIFQFLISVLNNRNYVQI